MSACPHQPVQFPKVQVVKSTSWEQLQPRLEEAFAIHGIPERITTDGGPPYSIHEFRSIRPEHHMTTPEDAQTNGFAEAFAKIMVKLLHTANSEGDREESSSASLWLKDQNQSAGA